MRYYKNGNNIICTVGAMDLPEITEAQYLEAVAESEKRAERQNAFYELTRQLTESEVSRMLISAQINNLSVDDNTALRMLSFYPTWESMIGKTLTAEQTDFKVTHGDKLWKVTTPGFTFQKQWEPGAVGTESIFTEVCETHDGTLEDPILYDGNMELEQGKYYMQNYEIYLCNRDTINPVYNTLSELVGLYVEIV